MAKLTEDQVETLAENFLKKVDEATAPGKMSIEDAIALWEELATYVRTGLEDRIAAGETDLG